MKNPAVINSLRSCAAAGSLISSCLKQWVDWISSRSVCRNIHNGRPESPKDTERSAPKDLSSSFYGYSLICNEDKLVRLRCLTSFQANPINWTCSSPESNSGFTRESSSGRTPRRNTVIVTLS